MYIGIGSAAFIAIIVGVLASNAIEAIFSNVQFALN